LWVSNIPVDGEKYRWIYERSYILTAEKDEDMIDHRSYIHNLSSCEIKAWKNSGLNGIPVQCSTNSAIKPTGSWSYC